MPGLQAQRGPGGGSSRGTVGPQSSLGTRGIEPGYPSCTGASLSLGSQLHLEVGVRGEAQAVTNWEGKLKEEGEKVKNKINRKTCAPNETVDRILKHRKSSNAGNDNKSTLGTRSDEYEHSLKIW